MVIFHGYSMGLEPQWFPRFQNGDFPWLFNFRGDFPRFQNGIPSGKHTKKGKSPCYQWVNPLFRLGHFQ